MQKKLPPFCHILSLISANSRRVRIGVESESQTAQNVFLQNKIKLASVRTTKREREKKTHLEMQLVFLQAETF